MDLKQIKEFLRGDDKEIKDFVAELKKDGLVDFLGSDDGYKVAKPFIDKKITQAIETYKEKTLPDLVSKSVNDKLPELEKEIKTRYNVKDPENPEVAEVKKQLQALQQQLAAESKAKARLENLSRIKGKAEHYGIESFAEKFVGESPEETEKIFEQFQTQIEAYVQKQVETTVKSGKYTPKTGDKTVVKPWEKMTDAEIAALPQAEQDRILDEITKK